MLTILFATLGYTANLAMAPLKDHGIRHVHLFQESPPKPKGKQAIQAAERIGNEIGIPVTVHPVEGAFDYAAILEMMDLVRRKHPKSEIIVNGSAGTRPMVMASTIFAFIHDLPLVYYDDYETKEGKEIPLRAYKQLPGLGESQRRIVDYLNRQGSVDMGELSQALKLARSTLTVHVKKLQDAGFLDVQREGKRRIVTIDPEMDWLEAKP